MDKSRKKALARAYKERKIQPGIYAVRCTATGEVWVDSTPNLGTIENRIWYMLSHGFQRNQKMQAAWKTHGEEAFRFEEVEAFKEDLSAYQLQHLYKERKAHWKAELAAESCH